MSYPERREGNLRAIDSGIPSGRAAPLAPKKAEAHLANNKNGISEIAMLYCYCAITYT